MIYNSTITLPGEEGVKKRIFLAGSMDVNVTNTWRNSIVNELYNTYDFFDPTIDNHDNLTDTQMRNHILWELKALELSDIVLLNLLPESKSPISLIELGMYVKTNKLIVVCPEEFYTSRYLEELCSYYKVDLYKSLLDFLNDFIRNNLN